ncbi:lysylphosphatidylglycerol synthase transmembrane domain-containing protein [Marinilabilia rubra]|uniref:Lysylphosphatidylglycerol synthetase family protein n=1 Tax=Marinilabilia rubra TaxID=2162893 RepID=A0A2U2B526_9BACT|nr:lysylphosphatidylglycerol synthase transmembrane domain-containing protein [Marinilabilia rubra]PWD98170.1 lysylphosphatidylglycerol synthetase family protein [Marinilabilia rubra]
MLAIKNYGRHLKLITKILVSGVAIYFIASKMDLSIVLKELTAIHPFFLITAVTLYMLSQIISSHRLNTLFKALPLQIPFLSNVKLYWVGMFYNFFLPGGVGGDGYKVVFLRRHFSNPVKNILSAIISDRVSGLMIIGCFVLGLSYFVPQHLPLQEWFFLLIPLSLLGFYFFLKIINHQLNQAFWQVSGLSLLIQGIQVVAVICLLFAIDVDIAQYGTEYLLLFFLSTIASAVPITLGGIGAREMVFFSGSLYMGTDPGQALALSILFYLTTLISSLPGLYFVVKPNAIQIKDQSFISETASIERHRA